MMKKIIAAVLAASLLLVMITAMDINPERLDGDVIFVDEEDIDEQALYDELFDINSVVQIDVDIAKDELRKIQQDYEYYSLRNSKSPIYRKAKSVTFTINGKKYVIEEVGIRMKGSTSRSNFYNDVLGIYNLVNFKLSFTQTFDNGNYYSVDAKEWSSETEREKRQHRTFATLDRLEVKWNSTADNTYARTIYMHEMFRDYGIPTQQCALADYRMGGCKIGLCRIFEPIDEEFLHKYLPEDDWGGDLYKIRCTNQTPATYTIYNTYGINKKNDGLFHNFDLKTNQETTQHESLKRLLEVVNQGDVTKEELEEVIDTDKFALFCAINFITGSQDDMRNNYNNHYIYFRQSDGKAIFIPYDLEICLGDTYSWDPSGSSLTAESPYADYNYRFNTSQENPFVRQTVLEGGYFVDQYTEWLRVLLDSKWMTVEHYQTYYDILKANYSDRVISPYHFLSTMGQNLEFSMEGGEKANGNMSIAEFMEKMKANLSQYIETEQKGGQ